MYLRFVLVMFLLSLTAAPVPAFAASGGDVAADRMSEQKKDYDAHRPFVKLHFDDQEMDFVFEWLLGSTVNGGCDVGEAFYTAGQIKDGDPISWQKQWAATAARVEAEAEAALKAGHPVTARDAFFRAANYYRTALVSVLPEESGFLTYAGKCRSTFRQGAALVQPAMDYFEIPFEGGVLPGYFRRVDDSDRKRKTIIMIGGGETFAEEVYFYLGPAAIKRGWNFLTVDLPGQGLLPLQGQPFRADMEVPLKAVLDFALTKAEVDPDRLAVYGISGGGYFVPRTAVRDSRIKACIVNSAVTDMYAQFQAMPNAKASAEELAAWPTFKRRTAGVVSWRFGLEPTDITGLAGAVRDYRFDPARLTCPVLILTGAGEAGNPIILNQAKDLLAAAPNKHNKQIIARLDQGAASHCMGGARSLMSGLVFDWLEELWP